MAGVGLDARIVYHLSAPLKSKLGKVAYWASAMKLIGRDLEEFDVKVDDRIHQCSFALISKVRNYGGDFEIACDTSLLDDRFEVVLFEGRSSLRYLKYFTAVALKRAARYEGRHRAARAQGVSLGVAGSEGAHPGGWRVCRPAARHRSRSCRTR